MSARFLPIRLAGLRHSASILALAAVANGAMACLAGQRAIAERDCAPWDGPAFGVWIPAESLGGAPRSWIHLRIWRAPEQSLMRFEFPDHSVPLPKGSVIYFTELSSPQAVNWSRQPRQNLEGDVTFTSVRTDRNMSGAIDLLTSARLRLRGRFEAQWIHRPMLCG